jgi:transposase InsO family protein
MKALAGQYTVSDLCRALAVSRSGYYGWRQDRRSPRAVANAQLDARIREVYQAHRGRYGSPRVTRELKKQGAGCSENRVARRMKTLGLAARAKKGFVPRTTDSRHGGPICANRLLEREKPRRPHEVWLSDITYIATGEGWLYLAGFLDAATRRLVGWSVGPTLEADLVCRSLNEARARHRPKAGQNHPQRPRQPVRQRSPSPVARKNPRRAEHEPPGQLLRQRHDGIVLEHAQSRVLCQLPARHPSRSPPNDLPVHRDLLQPREAAQLPRLPLPGGLRKPNQLNQTIINPIPLSAKSGDAHAHATGGFLWPRLCRWSPGQQVVRATRKGRRRSRADKGVPRGTLGTRESGSPDNLLSGCAAAHKKPPRMCARHGRLLVASASPLATRTTSCPGYPKGRRRSRADKCGPRGTLGPRDGEFVCRERRCASLLRLPIYKTRFGLSGNLIS